MLTSFKDTNYTATYMDTGDVQVILETIPPELVVVGRLAFKEWWPSSPRKTLSRLVAEFRDIDAQLLLYDVTERHRICTRLLDLPQLPCDVHADLTVVQTVLAHVIYRLVGVLAKAEGAVCS